MVSRTGSATRSRSSLARQSAGRKFPTVSTVIPTYNQQGYIGQAIESALAQEGSFVHEILVANDGSTDSSQEIVDIYCEKYPGQVISIGGKKNIGLSLNFRRCFESANGYYVAVLEGDDYWTDNKKLDRQVQFLESNDDCSMVFSKILVDNVSRGTKSTLERQENIKIDRLSGEDFIADPNMNLIANFSSCMFKSCYLKELPGLLFKERINEISMSFYLERFGKIGFINEIMSVYRQHSQGVWTGSAREEQLRAGLRVREVVLMIADERYRGRIESTIKRNYIDPLSKLHG